MKCNSISWDEKSQRETRSSHFSCSLHSALPRPLWLVKQNRDCIWKRRFFVIRVVKSGPSGGKLDSEINCWKLCARSTCPKACYSLKGIFYGRLFIAVLFLLQKAEFIHFEESFSLFFWCWRNPKAILAFNHGRKILLELLLFTLAHKKIWSTSKVLTWFPTDFMQNNCWRWKMVAVFV